MISPTGIWSEEEAIAKNYPHSERLCFRLIFELFDRNKWVIDLGCGDGYYLNKLWDAGFRNICGIDGYQGNKSPLVEIADLTKELEILMNTRGQVLSLEVGEHIPQQYEQIFIDNLCRHCDSRMVISWAIEGQGGIGHVNCRNNYYVIDQIEKRGFEFNAERTHYLRADIEIEVSYFRNTLLVFDKRCKHQFNSAVVLDLNQDPRCIHCGWWLSKIIQSERITLEIDEDKKHFTAKKI